MKTLQIEKSTLLNYAIKLVFSEVLHSTIDEIIAAYNKHIPILKLGSGSSHIWISNSRNERIAIIYLNN